MNQDIPSFKELIFSKWLPAALRIGISYNDFWSLNPKILNLLFDAYRSRKDEDNKIMDLHAWLAGMYVREAVVSALAGRKHKYPEKPYVMQNVSQELSGEEKFKLWAAEFNRRFEG